jgi:hypothetical protein
MEKSFLWFRKAELALAVRAAECGIDLAFEVARSGF